VFILEENPAVMENITSVKIVPNHSQVCFNSKFIKEFTLERNPIAVQIVPSPLRVEET